VFVRAARRAVLIGANHSLSSVAEAPMGLFDWFRSKPECPVDPATREWIDRRWQWLEDQFGAERVRDSPVVLPRPEFFPDPYHATEDDARRVLDRVCGYMGIEPATVRMSLYDESDPTAENPIFAGQRREGSAGLYHAAGGGYCVSIEAGNLHDPLALVATMAHELGHVHLLGAGRVSPAAEDHEPLTDLLTVFFGLGVFTANAVIREQYWHEGNSSGWKIGRRGYLGMPVYGYAFARFAISRGEDGSAWSRELRPDVRSSFEQALRFLGKGSAPPAPAGVKSTGDGLCPHCRVRLPFTRDAFCPECRQCLDESKQD
jgi:hypothetical protein